MKNLFSHIPDSWEYDKIENFYEYTKKPRNSLYNGNIPFIPMDSIPLDRLFVSDYILKQKVSSGTYIENGDFLLAKITPSFENGKQAIVDIPFSSGYATTEVIPIKGIENKSIILYLFFLLKNPELRKSLAGKMEGSTGRQRLSKTVLSDTRIPLPPLPEQRKIAYTLATIQKAIEKQEEIIKTTAELKKAMMQKFFTEGLHGEPQKETEIGLVPESWEVVKFNDFCTLKRGKDLTKENFVEGNIPVAGSNGIIGYHNTSNTKAPGITVGRSGSCGKVTYYNRNFWAHNTSLVVIDFHKNDKLFTYFYLIHMNLSRFKSGASVPTLDRNQFKEMQIGVPGLNEQKEIAVFLSTIDRKIEFHSKKKEKINSLFKSLLNQLMTGQLRVNNIDFPNMED